MWTYSVISKSLVLEIMSHIWLIWKINYKDLKQIYTPQHQFWPQFTTFLSEYSSFDLDKRVSTCLPV